jgi:uncharacterized protein (TIRG00374 family)
VLKNRWTVICAGLAVSAVFVYLAMRGLNFSELRAAFSDLHLMPWLPIGIASYLVSHVFRGIRCRVLVRKHARLSLATATNIVVVGYGANNVLPARLGELVRAGMLAERAKMPLAQSLGVTFIERVLDGLTLLLFLAVTSLTVEVAGWMRELVFIALAVFGVATIVMIVGAIWPRVVISLTRTITRPFGATWQAKFERLAIHVTDAGACFRDPKDALLLVLLSIVVWSFEAALYVCILPIFGIPMTVQFAVITMCVTSFGILLPSSPGAIGPYHYFASQALMVHGVAAPTALAYATFIHLSWFIPITIWGAAVMLWYGVELSSVAALAKRANDEAAPSTAVAAVPPSA